MALTPILLSDALKGLDLSKFNKNINNPFEEQLYLKFNEKKGWSVEKLGLLSRILRYITSFFFPKFYSLNETHLEHIYLNRNRFLGDTSKLTCLNNRMTDAWNKAHPLQPTPMFFTTSPTTFLSQVSGIANRGLTCYLSAAVHSLFSLSSIQTLIKETNYYEPDPRAHVLTCLKALLDSYNSINQRDKLQTLGDLTLLFGQALFESKINSSLPTSRKQVHALQDATMVLDAIFELLTIEPITIREVKINLNNKPLDEDINSCRIIDLPLLTQDEKLSSLIGRFNKEVENDDLFGSERYKSKAIIMSPLPTILALRIPPRTNNCHLLLDITDRTIDMSQLVNSPVPNNYELKAILIYSGAHYRAITWHPIHQWILYDDSQHFLKFDPKLLENGFLYLFEKS